MKNLKCVQATALIALLINMVSFSYADGNDLPLFETGESYKSVREKMIQQGWKPFHSKNADICARGDARCEGRPEMEACSGVGLANCKFLWVKDSKNVAICTVGEDAEFDAICN